MMAIMILKIVGGRLEKCRQQIAVRVERMVIAQETQGSVPKQLLAGQLGEGNLSVQFNAQGVKEGSCWFLPITQITPNH